MKPSTLKNKIFCLRDDKDETIGADIAFVEDVKSAVEWYRNELDKIIENVTAITYHENIIKMYKKIDEAFPDLKDSDEPRRKTV